MANSLRGTNIRSPNTGHASAAVKNGDKPNISAISPEGIYCAAKYTNAILGNKLMDAAK